MRELIDLVGKRYGALMVLRHHHKNARNEHYWLCQCDCGKQSIARGDKLRAGQTVSCGDKKTHNYLPRETAEELDCRIKKAKAYLDALMAKRKTLHGD